LAAARPIWEAGRQFIRSEGVAVESHQSRRILIVAHKSIAAPALLEAIQQRIAAGPCTFSLLIPDGTDRTAAAWTLRYARRMLAKTVGAPIDGVVAEGEDAFLGVVNTVRGGDYDEIMISLLPGAASQWLHEDLPGRAESLGIPITIVQPDPVTVG
jgi:hypothetical protein